MANATPDYSRPYQPLAQDTPEYQQFLADPTLADRSIVKEARLEISSAFDTPQDVMLASGRATAERGGAAAFVPALPGYIKGADTRMTDFLRGLGSKQAAMATLAEAEDEVKHNTEYTLNLIGPEITRLTNEARANRNRFKVADLSDEQISQMATAAGADPIVAQTIMASGRNPFRSRGIDLASRVRREAVRYDSAYLAGKKVDEDLDTNLFSLQNPTAKAQAYRNLAYYRSVQSNRFFSDAGHAIVQLVGAAGSTAGNLVGGTAEAVIGVPMMDEAISPSIAQDRVLRNEVQQTLNRAAQKSLRLKELADTRLKDQPDDRVDRIGLQLQWNY